LSSSTVSAVLMREPPIGFVSVDLSSKLGTLEIEADVHYALLTQPLYGKREHIAAHKDFRHPRGPDDGMMLCIDQPNDSPENHVDGGGVERRGDKNENGLDDVGRDCIVRLFLNRDISKDVPNSLDYFSGSRRSATARR
jgi:hypothetical protein